MFVCACDDFFFLLVYCDDDEVDIFSVRRPFPISAGVDICLGAPPPQLDIDDQLHAPYYNIIILYVS